MAAATATFYSDDQPLRTAVVVPDPGLTTSNRTWADRFTAVTAALRRLLARRMLRRERARVGFMERRVGTASLLTLLLLVVLGSLMGIAVSSALIHGLGALGLHLSPSAQDAASLGGTLTRLAP